MNKKIHFYGLDGLRFISISFVVLHHLLTFRNYYSDDKFEIPVIGRIGYYGIQFFFAGSGFLITYLLLTEFHRNGKISIGKFYMRRILRIWPAYYVLIILSLVIFFNQPFFQIPQVTEMYMADDFKTANLLFFSFLPHIAGSIYATAPYIHQTYTIGIEEQFYFIWGLMFLVLARHVKWIFWCLLIGTPILGLIAEQQVQGNINGLDWLVNPVYYLKYCRFSTFAIGALWAIAFFKGKEWINVFRKPIVQILVYSVLVFALAINFEFPYLKDEFISVLTLCVFTIATFPNDSFFKFNAKWLSYLGTISYGIYLFHIYAIVLAIKFCSSVFGSVSSWWQIIVLILVTLFLAILFGWISYYTIEKFFLRIKKRLAKV